MELPTIDDVEEAARRIAPAIRRTPLLRADALDEAVGGRVFVKAECLQRFGAFKIRGAYNKIASLAPEVRARGVLAFSSGNHAIAVAAAARDFGVRAVIVMPADAPAVKRETTAALGGAVVLYDRITEDREAIGQRLADDGGLTIVRPFDDPFIIAGQGTIGLEIAEDMAREGAAIDSVLVNCSGGGLGSGIATALAARAPAARVTLVEPAGHDDFARSLAEGRRVQNAPGVRSICDALLSDAPGAIPFEIARARGLNAVAIEDGEALAAMAFAFRHLKIVLEPSGAAALGAALARRVDLRGSTSVLIASGGNVDTAMFQRALAA